MFVRSLWPILFVRCRREIYFHRHVFQCPHRLLFRRMPVNISLSWRDRNPKHSVRLKRGWIFESLGLCLHFTACLLIVVLNWTVGRCYLHLNLTLFVKGKENVTPIVLSWVSRLFVRLSTRMKRFDPRLVHVGCVMDRVTLGHVTHRALRLTLSASFHSVSYSYLSTINTV